jgi:hypothetical protein
VDLSAAARFQLEEGIWRAIDHRLPLKALNDANASGGFAASWLFHSRR